MPHRRLPEHKAGKTDASGLLGNPASNPGVSCLGSRMAKGRAEQSCIEGLEMRSLTRPAERCQAYSMAGMAEAKYDDPLIHLLEGSMRCAQVIARVPEGIDVTFCVRLPSSSLHISQCCRFRNLGRFHVEERKPPNWNDPFTSFIGEILTWQKSMTSNQE